VYSGVPLHRRGRQTTVGLRPALTTATLCWRVCRNRRCSHCREFRTVQRVLSSVLGNMITSRQLYNNFTGCQFRLACSSNYVRSCTTFITVTVRRTCLMRCSRSRLRRREKDYDRLAPRTVRHSAWNLLPEIIREAQTQAHYKKLFKTFLFAEFL